VDHVLTVANYYMSGLKEDCKEPYSQQAGYIISLALSCFHFFSLLDVFVIGLFPMQIVSLHFCHVKVYNIICIAVNQDRF